MVRDVSGETCIFVYLYSFTPASQMRFACMSETQDLCLPLLLCAGYFTIWEPAAFLRKCGVRTVCLHYTRIWQLHGLLLDAGCRSQHKY